MKIYAGIGSRSTPPEVCEAMTQLARHLDHQGWVLRSGHADGADQAFEAGAKFKEIFLPWPGFNYSRPGQFGHTVVEVTQRLEQIARYYHPAWQACSSAVRKLHIRNVAQVLGADCATPADMVICWTPNGSGEGGTGQAIRIAKAYKIPVFDIALESAQQELLDFVNRRQAA